MKANPLLALVAISMLTVPIAFGNGEVFVLDGKGTTSPALAVPPENSKAGTPSDLLDFLGMLYREQAGLMRRDRMLKEKLEDVRTESYCMTAEKLMAEVMEDGTSSHSLFRSVDEILGIVHEEPRFLKLLELRGATHEVERAEVIACIRVSLDKYLNELPLLPADSDPYGLEPTVLHSTRGASVAALALAEYDPDGSALPYVARLHARSQEAHHARRRAESPGTEKEDAYGASFDGGVFAAAERILLSKLKDGAATPGAVYPFNAAIVLAEYDRLASILDEKASSVEVHFAEVTRDVSEQSELFRIASLSLVE